MRTPTTVDMTPNGLHRTGPDLPQGECYCGVCTMQTLADVADAIASVQNYRRKIGIRTNQAGPAPFALAMRSSMVGCVWKNQ